MNATEQTDVRCPECGASFTIDSLALIEEQYIPPFFTGTMIEQLPTKLRPATVAFCNACDFVHEITF